MDKALWNSQLEKYDALVNLIPDLVRKGKTVPYTSSNGYMFSLLNKEAQFGIRLSKEHRQLFDANYGAEIFKSHGAIMKDYVLIPNNLLAQPSKLVAYLKYSWDYVNSLPPK